MPCITLQDIGEDMYSKEDVDRLVRGASMAEELIMDLGYKTCAEAYFGEALRPFRQQQPMEPDRGGDIGKYIEDKVAYEVRRQFGPLKERLDSLAAKVK